MPHRQPPPAVAAEARAQLACQVVARLVSAASAIVWRAAARAPAGGAAREQPPQAGRWRWCAARSAERMAATARVPQAPCRERDALALPHEAVERLF